MRHNVADVLAYAQHETEHSSRDWRGLCQQFARTAWGLPPFGSSARIAWGRIPEKHRHYTPVADVPAGAICYDPRLGTYGHAWIAAGHGKGYTTDYRRRGHIDLAPLNLPAWTHDTRVHWVDATPYGPLPLR